MSEFWLDPSIRVLIADLGISPAVVLRRAGLPGDLFSRGTLTLDAAPYYRFLKAVDAELESGYLPVEIARKSAAEGFAVPVFACLCSRDLRAAARRLVDYKPLVSPVGITVTSTVRTGLTITFDWSQLPQPPTMLVWTELLFAVAVARLAIRTRVIPTQLVGPRVSADAAEAIRDYAGIEPTFGRRSAVRFDHETATAPFLTANTAMLETFDPSIRVQLVDLDRTATFTERVRVALIELLPSGRSAIGDVAHHLATSSRTLQRRLNQEETTFQLLLATSREQLAHHYLNDQDLPEPQIAFLLGYEDPASFRRAFRDWTGATPRQTKRAKT